MEDSSSSGRNESAPPSPPRWKGVQSLDLVRQLNMRTVELLCRLAEHGGSPLEAIALNREAWLGVSLDAKYSLAMLPFVLVDARFVDTEWWRRVSASDLHQHEARVDQNGLPDDLSAELMHETMMFAWQTARWDRLAAQFLLGMSSRVANIIAALTPQQVRAIAVRDPHAVRIRWGDDPMFWRDLLSAASTADHQRLAMLQLTGKLRICSELADIRD
jgi:Flagellar transcriptional activator (FlhD)